MTNPHPIVEYCQDKGKDVDFVPGNSGTLFDAANGYVRHEFDYRDETRLVTAKLKAGETRKQFWSRLLREIRKEKHYVDQLWEHGSAV